MSWDRQLDVASFGGVEFQVERVSDTLARRIREYRYPGRNGADLDDLGREPRRTSLTAVFHGSSYEAELSQFLQVVDAGKAATFVHPTLGTWTARATIGGVDQDYTRRDCAMVQVEVVEDGTSTELPTLFSLDALAAEVTLAAYELGELNLEAVDEVTTAADAALAFAADVKDSMDSAAAAVNEVRRKIENAQEAIRSATDFANYPLVKSLRKVAYTCQKLATRVEAFRPSVVAKDIPIAMPLPLLAHELYGDRSRADQLTTLNPSVRNPFVIPPGTRLKVHGES